MVGYYEDHERNKDMILQFDEHLSTKVAKNYLANYEEEAKELFCPIKDLNRQIQNNSNRFEEQQ